jgi:hypothetical protein
MLVGGSAHSAVGSEELRHLSVNPQNIAIDAVMVAGWHGGGRRPDHSAPRSEVRLHLCVHRIHVGSVLGGADRGIHLGADIVQPPVEVDDIELLVLHPCIDACAAHSTALSMKDGPYSSRQLGAAAAAAAAAAAVAE